MAGSNCRKCGGGGGTKIVSPSSASASANSEMVLIEYIGTQGQKRRLRSKVNPREQYVFSEDSRRFFAYKQDAEWLVSMAEQFKKVDEPTITLTDNFEDVPVLVSAAKVAPVVMDMPLDVLTIDPITLALLRKRYNSISELRNTGRSDWMTIKGIGANRADMIAEALNAL